MMLPPPYFKQYVACQVLIYLSPESSDRPTPCRLSITSVNLLDGLPFFHLLAASLSSLSTINSSTQSLGIDSLTLSPNLRFNFHIYNPVHFCNSQYKSVLFQHCCLFVSSMFPNYSSQQVPLPPHKTFIW
ncbi:hypothetical protein ATANTOWER_021955 [Ataeniobius toweri]|uniref:Uncharacterized protein n=1 Tax=Ataeniobius toweri TaxID=208326 RepID=A0ABU7BLY7_9TELE|nr:hypothetical protein [Ataeniobius toweri]